MHFFVGFLNPENEALQPKRSIAVGIHMYCTEVTKFVPVHHEINNHYLRPGRAIGSESRNLMTARQAMQCVKRAHLTQFFDQ